MKLDNKIKFTDKAIASVIHADYEFTYITKDGSTKTSLNSFKAGP